MAIIEMAWDYRPDCQATANARGRATGSSSSATCSQASDRGDVGTWERRADGKMGGRGGGSTPVEPSMVTGRWVARRRRQDGDAGILWEIDLPSLVILEMSSQTDGLGPDHSQKPRNGVGVYELPAYITTT